MPRNLSQTSNNVLRAPLPDLSVGRYHTESQPFTGKNSSVRLFSGRPSRQTNNIQPLKRKLDRLVVSHGSRYNVAKYYLSKEQIQVGMSTASKVDTSRM